MRRVITVLALVLGPAFVPAAAAQQPSTIVEWDYVGTAAATAQSYAHTLTIDGTVQAGAVTCSGSPTASCRQTVPALSSGPHAITVSALISGVQRSTVANVDTSKGPAPQSNIRVSVTVTVTVP